MGWTETQRYYRALREIEAHLDRAGDGVVPWTPAYAQIFGDEHTLEQALRLRWRRLVEAQVEGVHPDGSPSAALIALADAHPGLVRALVRTASPSAATSGAA